MTTFVTSTHHLSEPVYAVVKCDNGTFASLYFHAGDGPEVAIVGIPSSVAIAAAAAFNKAMETAP